MGQSKQWKTVSCEFQRLGQLWRHPLPHRPSRPSAGASYGRCAFHVLVFVPKKRTQKKILHFEWSPPWHYISHICHTCWHSLYYGEDDKDRIILMKSRDRSLPPRPFSWLAVQRWPLRSTWPNWLQLTLVMLDSKQFQTPGRFQTPN